MNGNINLGIRRFIKYICAMMWHIKTGMCPVGNGGCIAFDISSTRLGVVRTVFQLFYDKKNV